VAEGKDADALINKVYRDKDGIVNVVGGYNDKSKIAYRMYDQLTRQILM